jgi:hypothetical protein
MGGPRFGTSASRILVESGAHRSLESLPTVSQVSDGLGTSHQSTLLNCGSGVDDRSEQPRGAQPEDRGEQPETAETQLEKAETLKIAGKVQNSNLTPVLAFAVAVGETELGGKS